MDIKLVYVWIRIKIDTYSQGAISFAHSYLINYDDSQVLTAFRNCMINGFKGLQLITFFFILKMNFL